MVQFIYLFDERDLSRIKKSRIKKSKWNAFDGVYLFPQTENFKVNHQWMRELKRRIRLNMLEARIRIPDDTPVLIGKYNGEHIEVSAAKVVSITREHEDPLGLEVIAPQKIEPKEIISFYKPPKVTWWRYYPMAKGVKPCGCEYCQRGEPYSKKIRLEYDNT